MEETNKKLVNKENLQEMQFSSLRFFRPLYDDLPLQWRQSRVQLKFPQVQPAVSLKLNKTTGYVTNQPDFQVQIHFSN